MTTRTCTTCRGPLNRGATGKSPHATTCLPCLVARALTTWTPPKRRRPRRECCCGCGRVGIISGDGLVHLCYQRLRRAGR